MSEGLLSEQVTPWLIRWSEGDESALQTLLPLVYDELHRLAGVYLRDERADHTLQPTALVHEAYLQLRKLTRVAWKDRAQLVGITAQIMRRILLEHARRRQADKRGGVFAKKVALDEMHLFTEPDLNIVALDAALEKFSKDFPRQAQVVELRFFGGLTCEETAEVMGGIFPEISLRTVERDWQFARAWLHDMMSS